MYNLEVPLSLKESLEHFNHKPKYLTKHSAHVADEPLSRIGLLTGLRGELRVGQAIHTTPRYLAGPQVDPRTPNTAACGRAVFHPAGPASEWREFAQGKVSESPGW